MAMTRDKGVFFEAFYQENFQKLVAYAYRFLNNWEDAKEVTQEAFLTALIKIDQFCESESPHGWIKSTIRKKAQNLNKLKANRTASIFPLEETNPLLVGYDHYAAVDAPSAYSAELLSKQEFLLIQRIFMEGESYCDTAKEFGITEGACRKRVERIIKKLRERWDKA